MTTAQAPRSSHRTDARRERDALCDSASRVGPDAPTLCAGWDVRDLLVHLAVRDNRPDVVLGEAVGPLRPRRERVLAELGAQPFEELVERVRNGPHGPLKLQALDSLANTSEFFVHHEDILRAQDDWAPRELPRGQTATLWRTVRVMGRVAYRRAGVGVVLVTPGGPRAVVRSGEEAVSLTGEPAELVLHAFGRRSRAKVEIDGTPAAVQRFRKAFPG
ncbi:TIGR03085 family metal-binding protein [Kineococcus sp. GCM10028916]|uniref:TIGR03085 family metal-binding protein n=1 Tax=Kineococcus sp. GCM10028916 TaxID=3273394 RepID=UPI00362885E4